MERGENFSNPCINIPQTQFEVWILGIPTIIDNIKKKKVKME